MNKNVGGYDRIGRLVIGPILIVVAIIGYMGQIPIAVGPLSTPIVAGVLLLIGAIALVTGLTQKCPMNNLLGLNTYR